MYVFVCTFHDVKYIVLLRKILFTEVHGQRHLKVFLTPAGLKSIVLTTLGEPENSGLVQRRKRLVNVSSPPGSRTQGYLTVKINKVEVPGRPSICPGVSSECDR